MSDRITIAGMRFLGRHGVSLEERLEPQPFEVDVIMRADLSPPADSDELVDTIDYSAVFSTVQGVVEGQSFRLIEALAGAIAQALLDGGINDVEVAVRKPKAPLPGAFQMVEARLRRRRDQGSG